MGKDVIYMDETECNFCGKEITEILFFAKTIGPKVDRTRVDKSKFAVMCPECYKKHGISVLGKGLGAKYEKGADGMFHQVQAFNENLD